jgi:putative SOS response-associated peptidase YedK
MCGRFTLHAPPAAIADAFGLPSIPELTPRYNIAPSQMVAAVKLKPDGGRMLKMLRWGLIPSWAAADLSGPKPINAKAETVAASPVFRSSFKHRRCLIPADGFFEWRPEGKKKVPFHFSRPNDELFALAGIWDLWEKGPPAETFAIITTEANDVVRPVHPRMPVMLARDQFDAWLDPMTPPAELQGMLSPFPSDRLEAVQVGQTVNKATIDGPECIEADHPPTSGLFS